MDNTKQLPTVLSFCTGYGGIERGLDIAGFEHQLLAHVEIEAYAIANLVNKMETGKMAPVPVWSNLKTFPAGLFRNCVDVLTAGYPCQPFSQIGRRAGSEDPRHLWPFINEIIREVRPGRIFCENVDGHISLGLNEVIADLEDLGYRTTWGVFSASEAGADHIRKRVYIMGDAKRTGLEGYLRHGEGEEGWPDQNRPDAEANLPPRRESAWKEDACPVHRVDDGCPDYVDRVRLLGNAVVPQTAARAWEVLGHRLRCKKER